tara:strand:- start:31 stop:414 length:384 start_codon:yes stop_codon:yes gene_type:complete
MLRVSDLEVSLAFYCDILGMRILRRSDYPEGQFTLVFIGYEDEANGAVIELTYNWAQKPQIPGTLFGHIALAVKDLQKTCTSLAEKGVTITRQPGPMAFKTTAQTTPENIAFISDPDGCAIELIERS